MSDESDRAELARLRREHADLLAALEKITMTGDGQDCRQIAQQAIAAAHQGEVQKMPVLPVRESDRDLLDQGEGTP